MPLRYAPIRAALRPRPQLRVGVGDVLSSTGTRAPFHSSRPLRDDIDNKNHYETLNVHPDASPAEIKKSFYSLSKTHHPDHNRQDPHASRRFMRISEAYSVLSHHEKRAKYDRDVLRRHTEQHHHGHGHRAKGSYHSTGPVGGRAPSGLSKRRGTFQGPPPSFFRSGGWGAHSAKRKAAHDESTGGAESGSGGSGNAAGSQHGGMGPGQDPFGHRDDVPHFDKQSHERTGQRIDQRRARRMAGEEIKIDSEGSMTGNFFLILGVLGLAIGFPLIFLSGWGSDKGKGKRNKKDKKVAA